MKHPRLIAFDMYINEEGTQVSNVQIHPGADSMVFHMKVLRENISNVYEFIETKRLEFLGTPNEQILEMAKKLVGSGVTLRVKSQHMGGFTRLRGT